MILAGAPFAESTLAGFVGGVAVGAPPPPDPPTTVSIDPYTVEINNIRVLPLINSLSVDMELGRQGTANFTLVNVSSVPRVGEPVRISFESDLIFAGMIDRVTVESNNTMSFRTYMCECVDYSYLLFRLKISKSYTNVQWLTLAYDVIFNMIAADGLSFGTLDALGANLFLPVVDANEVSAHDMLSETAAAIGGIFYLDENKKVNLVTAANLPDAPSVLDGTIVEHATLNHDRETYRNRQTITITGTPATQGQQPVVVSYTRQNDEQIAERQAVEGGTGIYNDFESITHPTSNNITDLQKLAVSYALIRLGITGALRQWVTIRTRAVGFKSGQKAVINLPQLGILSDQTWYIQKTSMQEESGRYAITTLELNSSTLTRRAQELWLEIVKRGKLVVMPPAISTSIPVIQTVTFTTTGSTNWVVPAGVLQIQVSCYGAGGGGGGSSFYSHLGFGQISANGGKGGSGGLGVSVIDVTPGETLTVVVGTKGAAGTSQSTSYPGSQTAAGTSGTSGQGSSVKRGSTALVSATGGLRGTGSVVGDVGSVTVTFAVITPGSNGGSGVGLGQINTTGGGAAGGSGGTGSPFASPTTAANGRVIIEY